MPTDKNRVQTYVDDNLLQQIKTYAEDNGLSQSQAVEQILKGFFQESEPAPPDKSEQQIRDIVDDAMSERLRTYEDSLIYKVEKELNDWDRDTKNLVSDEVDKAYCHHETASIQELRSRLETLERRLDQGSPTAPDANSDDETSPNITPIVPKPLNQTELAKRLSSSSPTLSRRRSQPDFPQWSQKQDPDGISWQWDGAKFTPLM